MGFFFKFFFEIPYKVFGISSAKCTINAFCEQKSQSSRLTAVIHYTLLYFEGHPFTDQLDWKHHYNPVGTPRVFPDDLRSDTGLLQLQLIATNLVKILHGQTGGVWTQWTIRRHRSSPLVIKGSLSVNGPVNLGPPCINNLCPEKILRNTFSCVVKGIGSNATASMSGCRLQKGQDYREFFILSDGAAWFSLMDQNIMDLRPT